MKKKSLKILSAPEQIKKFFGEEPLMAASIRVTKACNLRCPHCYASGGVALKNELKLPEMKSIIDQIAELKALHIFYTGGEPFMRRDLVEILKYTDKKGLGILISTNGQLVDQEILKKLKGLNIKLFQISIDGTQKIHDTIRGKGVWEKAVQNLKIARGILKKNVGIGTVMMKGNWRVLSKVLEQAVQSGADIFALMFLILEGRATEDLNPSPEEYIKALNSIFRQYGRYKDKIRLAQNTTIPTALVPKKWRDEGIHEKFACCSFPYCIAVEANGDVAPCDGFFNFPEMILGNVRKRSLTDIWRNSKLLKEIRSIKPSDLKGVCQKCIYKEYCAGGCRASAYSVYGNLTMPDPACQTIYEAGLFPEDCLVK